MIFILDNLIKMPWLPLLLMYICHKKIRNWKAGILFEAGIYIVYAILIYKYKELIDKGNLLFLVILLLALSLNLAFFKIENIFKFDNK